MLRSVFGEIFMKIASHKIGNNVHILRIPVFHVDNL